MFENIRNNLDEIERIHTKAREESLTGEEYEFLDYVSSVNISCGFHAGDPLTIKEALLEAKEKNVVVGAHIGFDDIQGFGYRKMDLASDELEALVMYQVGALMTFAKAYHMEIEHVRPHGAMYKQCATDFTFACNVAKAVKKCSPWLVYYGATGDVTQKVGEYVGITVAEEIFLDKTYNADGSIDFDAKDNSNLEFWEYQYKELEKALLIQSENQIFHTNYQKEQIHT